MLRQNKSCRFYVITLLASFYVFYQANAQQPSDICGQTGVVTTINSAASLQAITSCSTFLGSLSIGISFNGTFDLGDVEEIRGNLTIQHTPDLTSVAGTKLLRINGVFEIYNVTKLNTLSFPSLDSVNKIAWSVLVAMDVFDFKKGISSVTEVSISNTFLSTLAGINLKNADSVTINNNNRLRVADLALETVKTRLDISLNGRNCAVRLPNLSSSGTIVLRNVSKVELPSLKLVSESFTLAASSVEELVLSNLSVVTKNFTVQDNFNLVTLGLNEFLSGGAVYIRNNTKLATIDLPKFARADNVVLTGNFTELKTPALTAVGNFSTLTSSASFDCLPFDLYSKSNIIQGSYSCQSKSTTKTNGTSTGNANGANNTTIVDTIDPKNSDLPAARSDISGGAIGGIVVGVVAVISAIATFLFLRRRRNANTKAKNEGAAVVGVDGKAEMGGEEVKRTEMPAGGHEIYEAEGQHGVSEIAAKDRAADHVHELVGSEPAVPLKVGEIKRKPVL